MLKFFKKNETINAKKLKNLMGEGVSVYTFRKIDSTNSEAARRLHKSTSLPALFVTKHQTAGRGRRGRSFYSKGGLYMSLAIKQEIGNTVTLTTLASVAVAQAIEELCRVNVGIKWVNDLYLEGKKICGILCENICDPITGEGKGIIIGIGINLNVTDFPEELKSVAGSLLSKEFSAEQLCAKITENIIFLLNSPSDVIENYKKRSVVLGKDITYEQNGIKHFAKALDIDPLGGLVVQKTDSTTETLLSGEITVRF
ncbi:MAG: biotin--[acetyl-CoA-carboxylase] ligase [Acutalibacteraceae bacterium]|nr:biotin--[acetyl-CoA-carboxylase] ligase [Acutalibacteraceae bacterium]